MPKSRSTRAKRGGGAQLMLKAPTSTSVTVSLPRAPRRTVKAKRSKPSNGKGSSFLSSYAATLNDPWENAGIPLGYDNFLPSSIAAGYNRTTFTVNADGTFTVVLQPSVTASFITANGIISAAISSAASTLGMSNATSITNNFREVRVISGGVRLFVSFPATSAPGVIFAGSFADKTRDEILALTPAQLQALPTSKMGIGSAGARVTLRPYDNSGFEFFTVGSAGYASDALPLHTTTYISGANFPAGARVYAEAIMNLEGIAKSSVDSSAVPSDDNPILNLSDYFPTPGSLLRSVAGSLLPQTVMDGVDYAGGALLGKHRSAARLYDARQHMGSGSNFNSFVQARGSQSTILIEEMEDGPSASLSRPGRRR